MKKTFLKYLNAFTLVGITASLVVFTSCGDDDDTPPAATQTIWEIVEERAELSALESELLSAELDAALAADGEFTLFAPSNSAMETLLTTLGLENFDPVNPLIAQAVLTYHVVPQIINSGDLAAGQTYTTLQTEAITVAAGPTLVTGATSPSSFIVTDIQATNGVIHIIDVVMVPPTIGGAIVATLGTVAQPIFLGADFTTLAAAITKADSDNVDGGADEGEATIRSLLSDRTLTGDAQITVFAPTNATFTAGQITADTYDAATWEAILKNHVVVGQGGGTDDGISTLGPDDLTQGAIYNSLLGVPLSIIVGTPTNGLGIYIDSDLNQTPNAEVALADADGGSANGRIHVIAGVLAPPAAARK